MKKYKVVIEEVNQLASLVCNRCGLEADVDDYKECTEFVSFARTGGYYAHEGDEVRITYDLCDKCHSDLVREFATFTFDYFESDLPEIEYKYRKDVGYYTTNLIKDITAPNLTNLLSKVYQLTQEVANESDIFQNS